jgi:alcohol dehydrogenase YqhD (iron-dependent ADH family)
MGISRFYIPTRFIIGSGSLTQLGKEAARIGKTALLVTGSQSMRKTGVLDKVIAGLQEAGVKAVSFDKVEPNPRASTIDEGAKVARKNGIDLVIGMGGGSAMDAAKCIALATGGSDPIFAYFKGTAVSKPKALPIILVPTVAASGSEANNGAVFTNWETHEKVALMHPSTYPTCSIVDPALTITLPTKPTAQGGVDIFCHLVENYITAHESTLINDAIRESSMKTVVLALPAVLNKLDDIKEREKLSWASTIACSQFAGLGGGTGVMTLHGIEHPISGEYDVAHGDGLACLLIEWMKHTHPDRRDRFETLGKNVFGEPDGISATEKWLKRVGMDHRLCHLGAKEADFDKLADNAIRTAPWVKFHTTPFDKETIASIYKKSY